jgi:hypothetical protein
MRTTALLCCALLALVNCDKNGSSSTGGGPKPVKTAMDACHRLVEAGAASNCKEESVEPALTPGAKSRALFTLPSGKPGQVFAFDDRDDYDKSAKIIGDTSAAGPHHFGNSKAMIYVQLNKEATEADAQKVRSIVDGF